MASKYPPEGMSNSSSDTALSNSEVDDDPAPTAAGAAGRPRVPFVMPQPLRYEPATSTDEWLLTYGDMVTLLLTLFVLLVLTASFDKKKYAEEGQDAALRGVFSAVSEFRMESPYADEILPLIAPYDDEDGGNVYAGGSNGRSGGGLGGGVGNSAGSDAGGTSKDSAGGTSLALLRDTDLELIERREEALKDIRAMLVQQKLDMYVKANSEGDGIRLDIPNSILFEVGNVEVRGRGRSVLRALAPVLAKGSYTISVEGHTDNSPIDTLEYASNWELSANRAAKVVRMFIEAGIAPARLEAVGHADTRPLATNETADGRSENRRVTVLLRVGSVPDLSPFVRP